VLAIQAQLRFGALCPDPAVDDAGDQTAVVLLSEQAAAIGAAVQGMRGAGGEQEQPEHGGLDEGAGQLLHGAAHDPPGARWRLTRAAEGERKSDGGFIVMVLPC